MSECLICYEIINNVTDLAFCGRCNIKMHIKCFDKYNIGRGYTKCPHCQMIGVIGIVENLINKSNKFELQK